MKKFTTIKNTILAASLLITTSATVAKEVTIGYQGSMNPWKHAIAEKILEKETGYEIKWRRFDSGAKAMTAMASGAVDMTSAGSSPIAAALSRGVEMELVWILANIADAEALVVRDEIKAPADLKGKKIAVPFVSTTHFHMMFALETWGLTEKDVKLINMQPSAVAAAWQRGDIDGAFIWNPVLVSMKETGHVLISSKDLAAKGKPTFDGIMVSKEFSQKDPQFVTQVVKVLADLDSEYRDNQATFSASHPIAQSIAKVTGGDVASVPGALALTEFPSMEQQLSCAWLGCGAEGAAAKALEATSQFLKEQKKINELMPDYSSFVNPTFAEAAAKL